MFAHCQRFILICLLSHRSQPFWFCKRPNNILFYAFFSVWGYNQKPWRHHFTQLRAISCWLHWFVFLTQKNMAKAGSPYLRRCYFWGKIVAKKANIERRHGWVTFLIHAHIISTHWTQAHKVESNQFITTTRTLNAHNYNPQLATVSRLECTYLHICRAFSFMLGVKKKYFEIKKCACTSLQLLIIPLIGRVCSIAF